MAAQQQDPSQTAPAPAAPASTTTNATSKHPFLSRPLYVYDLPVGLPQSLKLRSIDATDPTELFHGAAPAVGEAAASEADALQPGSSASGPTSSSAAKGRVPPCTLCPSCLPFASVSAQRAHFRSDWHRYNVQLNLRSNPLVDGPSFDKLCEDVDTAGETDTDEEANKSQGRIRADTVTKLLQRLTLGAAGGRSIQDEADGQENDDGFGDERSARSAVTARSPLLWFTSREDADAQARLQQTQLGVYRGIFPDPGTSLAPTTDPRLGAAEWYRACLSSMQAGRLTQKGGKNRAWTGKRLKAQGAQEAAKGVMMTVLDGEGYLPGLKLESGRDSSDEDEYDSSDSDNAGSEPDVGVDGGSLAASSALSRSPEGRDPPLRMWTLLLMGGGHFAASVIALNPHVTTVKGRKGSGPREERSILLLAHKTFHRYTTRRKQGGGQAAQDATGRFAKSAGAQLRRYNEAALGDDIRTLLDLPGWRELIARSERIWIRAGARAAKGTLWNWEGGKAARSSPLDSAKEDGRLDSLPFPTRRPTIGETVRCFFELTRVKIERKTEEELHALDEAYRHSLSSQSRKEAEARQKEKQARERAAEAESKKREREAAAPKLGDEEKARRARFERLVEMVKRGRLETLVTFLNKNEADLLRPRGWSGGGNDGSTMPDDADDAAEAARRRIDAKLPDWWLYEQIGADSSGKGASDGKLVASTLLQLATEAGAEEIVRHLLLERRADPTLPVERAIDVRTRIRKQTHAVISTDTLTSTSPAGTAAVDGEGGDDDGKAPHRTAYDLASNRETRNVLRKAMADHPDWYDWAGMTVGGARVPSALTSEMEENQASKTKDRRAALREKARERAAKAASREPAPSQDADSLAAAAAAAAVAAEQERERQSSHTTTNRLGGGAAAPRALLQQRDQQAGLTPEMRARIEREKRARAAEERMKALSSSAAAGKGT